MSALSGKRVVVTRPVGQAAALCRLLDARNAEPIVYPTVQIVPFKPNPQLRDAFNSWDTYDWIIFTSVNGVRIVFEEAKDAGFRMNPDTHSPAFAAIGPATARALKEWGIPVQAVPDEFMAERLASALGDVAGKRILLPRAKKARTILRRQLEHGRATVVEIHTYDTIDPTTPSSDKTLEGTIDAVTFTSSSTVEGLFALLGERANGILAQTCVACIGPITAQTARAKGVRVDVVAKDYTSEGLVDALVSHFATT